MPKLKTHSGTKKRVRITKTGKLIRRRAFSSHFMSKKRGSRKRLQGVDHKVDDVNVRKIKTQLGVK